MDRAKTRRAVLASFLCAALVSASPGGQACAGPAEAARAARVARPGSAPPLSIAPSGVRSPAAGLALDAGLGLTPSVIAPSVGPSASAADGVAEVSLAASFAPQAAPSLAAAAPDSDPRPEEPSALAASAPRGGWTRRMAGEALRGAFARLDSIRSAFAAEDRGERSGDPRFDAADAAARDRTASPGSETAPATRSLPGAALARAERSGADGRAPAATRAAARLSPAQVTEVPVWFGVALAAAAVAAMAGVLWSVAGLLGALLRWLPALQGHFFWGAGAGAALLMGGFMAAPRFLPSPAPLYPRALALALDEAAKRGVGREQLRFVQATASMPAPDGKLWDFEFRLLAPDGRSLPLYVEFSGGLTVGPDARVRLFSGGPFVRSAPVREPSAFAGSLRVEPEPALIEAQRDTGLSGGVSVILREETVADAPGWWYRFYDDGGREVVVNAGSGRVLRLQ
ncbi:MAG: hypothetical protein HY554_07590 [Elusimicrobia bacterium]|nr:hypothetical protein [Elusimicrobiota bacterium]